MTPQPPVIAFMVHRTTFEGGQVGFLVRASDPNETIPALSIQQLPAGATFDDFGDGTGAFQWSPSIGQSGSYPITVQARDGQLSATRTMTIQVHPHDDTDGDGMNDDWERANFGNLDRDGTGDFDGDGRSDLQEYKDGTDPEVADIVPGMPQILAPAYDEEVLEGEQAPWLPELAVTNANHSDAIGAVAVQYEVYTDEAMSELLATVTVPEGNAETSVQLESEHLVDEQAFADNRLYYWRARSVVQDNPAFSSGWVTSRFFINSANDAPTDFEIVAPAPDSEVPAGAVSLTVTNSADIDRDHLYYGFTLYEETDLDQPLVEVKDLEPGKEGETSWRIPRQLNAGQGYMWQAQVTDEHGLATASEWAAFTVEDGGADTAPLPPVIEAPADNAEFAATTHTLELVAAASPDASAEEELSYWFELDTSADFNGADKSVSSAISAQEGEARWQTPALNQGTQYYWRVRVDDGLAQSPWVSATFSVNSASANTPPPIPVVNRPLNSATLDVQRPFFDVNPVKATNGRTVVYEFELYSDAALTGLISQTSGVQPYWQIQQSLVPGTAYYWRYRALDSMGHTMGWSDTLSFTITEAGSEASPSMTPIGPEGKYHVSAGHQIPIQWVDEDPDSSAEISLYYSRGNGRGGKKRLIVAGLAEDADGEGDTYLWDTTGMKPGRYQLEAQIQDEGTVKTIEPWGSVTIIRWRCSGKPSKREKQTNYGGKPQLPGFDTPCTQ